MAGLKKGCIYLGVKGNVLALDGGTGKELWRTRLKGGDLVTVATDQDRIYAATKGELFALDPYTGALLWNNKLKGLGWGLVSILTAQMATDLSAAASWKAAEQQAAASASV